MKQFYLILSFTITFLNAYASNNVLLPSATIAGTTTVCQNATSPLITFTGSGGTAPYTFTYTRTGLTGNQTISTTGTNSTITVSVPTGTAGTFTYTLVSVHDATLPIVEQLTPGTATVNVITVGIINPAALISCLTNQSQTSAQVNLILTLPSNPSLIQSITINWGDSTTPQIIPFSNWSSPIFYTYPLGSYTVTITATTTLGCNIVRTFSAFIGSSPQAATLSLFASQATGCMPHTTQFTFGLPVSNSDGTNYNICFGDNPSTCINYIDGTPIPSNWVFTGSTPQFNYYTITHIYNVTSCNNTVNLNGITYNNVFLPSVITTNPCTAPQPQAGSLISVGIAPTASFTPNPIPNICVNKPLNLNNTSNFGSTINPISYNCSSTSPFYWTVTPATPGLWTASGLGSNNSLPNDELSWTVGSMTPSITFNQPGNYTITLYVKNSCGLNSVSRTLCVEPPITPLFTAPAYGCIPLAFTAINNTVPSNQCSTPTYNWSVSYLPGSCGTSITPIPNQTTTNANFNFTQPGIYSITLTALNACTPAQTLTQIVTVRKPPTVSITSITDFCQNTSITPSVIINTCSPNTSPLPTYLWTFLGGTSSSSTTITTPPTIAYATPGSYSISLAATNECGTTTVNSNNFNVQVAPIIQNVTTIVCSGSAFSVTPSNAIAGNSIPVGTNYSWNAPIVTGGMSGGLSGTNQTSISGTLINTSATTQTATYTITPKIGTCSGNTFTLIVTVNPAPSITTQPSPSTVCLSGTPTPLSVALNSASVTPTYQWYYNTSSSTTGGTLIAGATSATYNPPTSVAGTVYYYCVISLSSGGCSSITSNVVAVIVNPLPTITAQPIVTQDLCVGVTTASPLTILYSGGTGTATYQWYSNTNNTTTGGTPVGTNSPSYTTPVFSAAGTYYYYVTISVSGNNCGTTTSTSAQITVFGDPTITTQPLATQTLCQGATPTTLQVAANGGNGPFSYQWYSNSANNTTSGTAISGANSATYIPPTTTVGTLYYYCIISQTATAGCSVTSATAAVIINASPTIVNQPISSTVCSGGTPTVLSLTFSNGVGTPTYQWYSNIANNNTTGTAIPGETNPTFSPPAIVVGTIYYYCTITFSGIAGSCATIATNTADVTVTAGSTINQHPQPTQNLCVGATILNPLTVTYTGGTGTPSYQWFSNTTNSNIGGTIITGAINVNYTPPVYTTSGNYYYYAVISFSGNGCGAITSNVAEVIVINDPILTTQPLVTQTVCQNSAATLLTVVASGGLGTTYNYQWYSATSNNTTSGTAISGETNSTYTPPTATAGTTYYYCVITQTNGTGCNATSTTEQVIINVAPAINAQPASSTICVNGSPTVLSFTYTNGVGTPTYQWYSNTTNSNTGGNIIASATNATYTPPTVTSGSTYYYCVITFSSLSGGCSVITTNPASVIVNDNPIITATITTICSTTSFTVTPANSGGNIVPTGTTYTWSAPTINPAGTITGASAQSTPQTNISQTLINITTNPSTVTYTVTPTSGVCIGATFTVTITVNPAINPNIVLNDNLCFGVNIATISTNITGGIPFSSGAPYQITWTGPNSFTSAATSISNLAPGNYDVTIADAGGCPFSNTYTITEPADIVITVDSENDITCFNSANGSINITVTGGTGNYSYTWTKNGNPYATSQDISNLSPGTYNVSVTDVNSCGPKTANFTITEPPLLVVNLVSQTNVLCYGAATGAITVNIVGGTPGSGYFFSWTGPNGFTSNTQNLVNIIAGTYNLVVTDANGCQKNLAVTITQSTDIVIAYTTTPITCYGADNASITVTLSGGISPYQYQWSNLATTLVQTNLSAGNYTITVTDNLGCPKVQTINIPQAPIFTVNPIVSNITCFGANNGSINLNLTGGIAPVALVWSDGSTSGLIRNNLPAGTYTATISDGTPCFITRTYTIVEPQAIVLSANLTNAFNCTNASSGAINLIVAGGTPPYSNSWNNGSTTEDLSNITSGNYLVTVTDANNCIKTAQFSITRPAPIVLNVNTQTTFDCAAHSVNQNFVAQAAGGIPPYQYQWSSGIISGANNEIMQSAVNGTVLLTVTDSYGCSATQTVVVDTPELGYPSFDQTSIGYTSYGIYAIGDPIQFQSTITGDYLSVSWDFGDGTFSTELNPIHTYVIPKDYVVTQTVTYPFGCVYVQTISLLIEKGYVLVVPTAFTPNDDTLNDTFRPVTKNLKNVQLDIYDTWGSLIYSETGDVLVGWDAKIKGVNAENGNYYCKVSGETFYGTIVNSNQTFVLIK